MTNLEQYITAKLDAMQTEKAKSTVVPRMVTKKEFFGAVDKDVRKVLNKLFIEKKLKVHPTKDGQMQDYVELISQDNDEKLV